MADASVTDRLVEQIEQRYRELEEQLADPDTISDRNRYAEVSKVCSRAVPHPGSYLPVHADPWANGSRSTMVTESFDAAYLSYGEL